MPDPTRSVLLGVPVDEKGYPRLSDSMSRVLAALEMDVARAAFRAAPCVTEDEIVRGRVMALPGYVDDDIPMVRDVVAIESFFLPRDELLRALGVPDVAEKEQKP